MSDLVFPSRDQVAKYNLLLPLLTSAFGQMQELSKKKPDTPLNDSKVKILNRILADCDELLKDLPVAAYLSRLSVDELPTNSDVVLMLGQYCAALEQFRKRFYRYYDNYHRWLTKEYFEEKAQAARYEEEMEDEDIDEDDSEEEVDEESDPLGLQQLADKIEEGG